MTSRTVQVHLNGLCNLSCRHCYSMSGPQRRDRLAAPVVMEFLSGARAEGYDVVAFSGGEPLLYDELPDVLAHVRQLGMRAIAVTNGTVFGVGRNRETIRQFDFASVSLDGDETLHNDIRASPTAYQRMIEGLGMLREDGVRFGIVYAVTRKSLRLLPDIAARAAAEGAEVLQLHPLGLVGAAATGLEDYRLDDEMLSRTYLMGSALNAVYRDKMGVHVDLFSREMVQRNLALIVPAMATPSSLLADLLNPLVLMANGDISPICHGMGRSQRLGNIADGPLPELRARFVRTKLPAFRQFCEATWQELEPRLDWPYFNWYDHLEQMSASRA